MRACSKRCLLIKMPVLEWTAAEARKSIDGSCLHYFFPNVRNCITNREFPQELFWMTLRNHGKQSNFWRQTGQPEMTPSVAFRVDCRTAFFRRWVLDPQPSTFNAQLPGASSPGGASDECLAAYYLWTGS